MMDNGEWKGIEEDLLGKGPLRLILLIVALVALVVIWV